MELVTVGGGDVALIDKNACTPCNHQSPRHATHQPPDRHSIVYNRSWLPPGANVLLFALVKVSFELFLSRCCVLVAAASVAWRVVTAGWWQLHRWLPLSWAVQAKRASLSQLTSATSFVVLVVSDSFWPTFALGEGPLSPPRVCQDLCHHFMFLVRPILVAVRPVACPTDAFSSSQVP